MPRPSDSESGAIGRLMDEWMERYDPARTQNELAELLGKSPKTLSAWRRRKVRVTVENLMLMHQRMDIGWSRLTEAAAEDLPAATTYVASRSTGRKPGLEE